MEKRKQGKQGEKGFGEGRLEPRSAGRTGETPVLPESSRML
jgi:hypothetical protein